MTERTLPAPPVPIAASPARLRPRLILTLVLTCQLMLILDATVMNVALPKIQADLGFSPTSLSWVMNAYSLVFGGLLLLGGRAGDLLGRRRMFVLGAALFTVASLAGGLADSATLLLVARVVQGIGAAAAGPSTLALIATTFTEPRERVRALALFSAMSSGGFGDLFGDPDEMQRRLAEFAEQMHGQQRLAWADNAIKLAVDMTVAAVERVNLQGNAEAQAEQIRTVMALVFPEAVTLVREARAGLQ